MEWSGVEWSGVEWSGVGWSGVEWSGVEWSGVEWSGVEWSGVEWSGVEWSGVEWSKLKLNTSVAPFEQDSCSRYEAQLYRALPADEGLCCYNLQNLNLMSFKSSTYLNRAQKLQVICYCTHVRT